MRTTSSIRIFPALVMTALLAACGASNASSQSASRTVQPAVASSVVSKTLAKSGIIVAGKLDAPKGYQGFVGLYHGQKLPLYVLPDRKHVVIGTLYDLGGHDLTSAAMRHAADRSWGGTQWQQLAASTFISTGAVKSGRIVYAFMDTECGYCHRFWVKAQPWIVAGGVELRVIPVAVISPRSLPEAEAILAADDPIKAWGRHEAGFGRERMTLSGKTSSATRNKLASNNHLMTELGFYGTPGIIYKDAKGRIHTLHGMPPDAQAIKAVFEG